MAAAGLGLEPRYSGPKPDVLPLDLPAQAGDLAIVALYLDFWPESRITQASFGCAL